MAASRRRHSPRSISSGTIGRLLLQAVEIPRLLGAIAAGHQHARRAPHVQPLAARLHRHGEPRQPALEAHLVGDHALERGHVARLAGDAVAIHVEPHRQIEIVRRPQPAVEQQPLGRVDRQAQRGVSKRHRVAERSSARASTAIPT